MKLKARIAGAVIAAAALVTAGLVAAPPAASAQLTEVTGFGTNPTNLRMHLYVPDGVGTRPAVLVAVHYCTGSGPAFHSGTEFASLADRHKFIVVYPSATRSGACFDVSSPQSLTHNGGSDPVGIVSMVRYVQQRYNADPERTYVTGASSGGMMTNVLIGAYPDVFKAGASFSGVPFGCFATTDGSSWNSTCANGQLIKTAQQWGDQVRAAYPGYSGPRPRMQIWHGTEDATLRYPNFQEQIKQWTNVHGLSQTPSLTDQPRSGWTRTRYGGTGTKAPVEAISLQGVGHNLPQGGMAAMAIDFFGLSEGGTEPTPTITPTVTPPVGACRITYTMNTWNTGFTAAVTVANTSTTQLSSWSLAFTLPAGQTVTSAWNASVSPSSGQVTARNVSYNATIAPGASASFGFQATHGGDTGKPPAFTLNGTACTS
ncbi:extracellular catalytic domain type 1 short-chain-length polyhydroxyalkanoate depolymerase [Nonomuraea gerenzanensis]|uniref:Endo-1,4-beta-xylanase A n=1 Tax=Nonomuraea gerenzanensis TaxID=93944 RepID=A0A1M4EKT6_9ACTN|nr:PHB depolymerase family esterase [Nonomuraea gerenzanensis]UBU11027.1 PHB depolymerase family esterase [Nonomuraea gerenzanensis]SBO99482.1 Endo-1,4-beta-xylanase A precursor [Nonomuraea gerenzanensis]